jgi:hypothetical protein
VADPCNNVTYLQPTQIGFGVLVLIGLRLTFVGRIAKPFDS